MYAVNQKYRPGKVAVAMTAGAVPILALTGSSAAAGKGSQHFPSLNLYLCHLNGWR
ncbi:MAG: hypothetical protein LM590_13165 [Thermofilum sp.]|nr:hypothetical protein [Thermofilum sp.]